MSGRFGGATARESGNEQEISTGAATRLADRAAVDPFLFQRRPARANPPPTLASRRVFSSFAKSSSHEASSAITPVCGAARAVSSSRSSCICDACCSGRSWPERYTDDERRQEAPNTPSSLSYPPVVSAEYLRWLRQRCATVDLLGLEPKHGVAAKLHTIYVPLTTSPGTAQREEAERLRHRRRALRDSTSLSLTAKDRISARSRSTSAEFEPAKAKAQPSC